MIRPMTEADFDDVWSIFHDVVAMGDSYVFAAETPRQNAIAYFFGPGIISRVSERNGRVVGMYKLIPNRIDRGNHVANASFMVAPTAAGHGVGRELGEHCLREAKRAGFLSMQFNFVVSTNTAAVSLWRKLGFEIVGTLPRAFSHATLGFVDAYVMYRSLDDIA
jgi:ribosomal protein S18 acetylase RimI-like enzyme